MAHRIFLQYYSRRNFGDDLFVRLFSEYFSDCKVELLCNPLYLPKKLGPNVQISPFSWTALVAGLLQARARKAAVTKYATKLFAWSVSKGQKKAKASVLIGGSIFKDNPTQNQEICFDISSEIYRDYSFNSQVLSNRGEFIIGANLGPAFHESYFEGMEQMVKQYRHVCLRDYASYCQLKNCPNVQYAPDVVFTMKPIRKIPAEKTVAIQVMDIAHHTSNRQIIQSYYTLLCSAIDWFRKREHKIYLVSFCKREGDEAGINCLLSRIPDRQGIEVLRYTGEIDSVIDCFSNASFVIASRFHSLILAAVCGKPVFPISYSCKTSHYLQDLQFAGNYATLDMLPEISAEDVIYNYEKETVCDTENHHAFACNQFAALRWFLDHST